MKPGLSAQSQNYKHKMNKCMGTLWLNILLLPLTDPSCLLGTESQMIEAAAYSKTNCSSD